MKSTAWISVCQSRVWAKIMGGIFVPCLVKNAKIVSFFLVSQGDFLVQFFCTDRLANKYFLTCNLSVFVGSEVAATQAVDYTCNITFSQAGKIIFDCQQLFC